MNEATNLPDLYRLRRFALAVGLVLFTYSLAAVELDMGETIRPLGVPLTVNSPEWLGIGLAVASLYALARFWYYGMATTTTPAAKRRSRLGELGVTRRYKIDNSWRAFPSDLRSQRDLVADVFPRIPGTRIKLFPEPPGGGTIMKIECIEIPLLLRLAARLQDVDYTAPIWVNGIALLTFGIRSWMLPLVERIAL